MEERHLSRKSPQPEDSDDSSDEEDGAGEAEVQFEGVLPEDTMRDDNPTHQPKPAENKDIYSFIKELKESPDGGMEARVAEMQSNEDSEDRLHRTKGAMSECGRRVVVGCAFDSVDSANFVPRSLNIFHTSVSMLCE